MAPICFFLLFLWDCALDKRPSGNDQVYWTFTDGDEQDSRSFGAILCFYLGTFRPLLLCWAHPKGKGAIKSAASFKRSGWPIDDAFSKYIWTCLLKRIIALLKNNNEEHTFWASFLLVLSCTEYQIAAEKEYACALLSSHPAVFTSHQRVATLFHNITLPF